MQIYNAWSYAPQLSAKAVTYMMNASVELKSKSVACVRRFLFALDSVSEVWRIVFILFFYLKKLTRLEYGLLTSSICFVRLLGLGIFFRLTGVKYSAAITLFTPSASSSMSYFSEL